MKKVYGIFFLLVVAILGLVWFLQKPEEAVKKQPAVQTENEQSTGFVAAGAGDYDSEDTAIVVRKDPDEKTISFRNLETGRQYTLSYDGTSVLTDKNGQPLTMDQVAIGDLVDVKFVKTPKTLTSLRESSTAFSYRGITDFTISESGRSMTIQGTTYRLSSDVAVVGDSKLVTLMDINENDTLTVRGFDNAVYSIVIDRGHGYLRLENDESFIGGWIEVGSFLVQPITENMMLTLPEGEYDISVSCDGSGGTKSVTIVRNEEQVMDVSDLVTEVKEGGVLFEVTPSTASVYVDGKKIDPSDVVTLTYGIHQVIIKADGYTTMAKYVRVGQAMATLTMELELAQSTDDANDEDNDSDDADDEDSTKDNDSDDADDEDSTKDNDSDDADDEDSTKDNDSHDADDDSTGNSDSDAVSASDGSTYYVSIDAPEGVEVYVDGNYVGLSPIRFKKVEGSHVIALRKSGYQTRSYTIDVDDEEKDVAYSFSELVPLSE